MSLRSNKHSSSVRDTDDSSVAAMLVYPTESSPFSNGVLEIILIGFTGLSTFCTIVFQFVAGLNVLPGLSFMSNWAESAGIMYMALAFSSVIALWLSAVLKSSWHSQKRPWQYNQELLYALICYSSGIFLSVVPLAVYAFKVGDIKSFCSDSVCLAGTYIDNKLTFGTLFLAAFLNIQFIVKIVFILRNTHETVTTITPQTAKRILEESGKLF